MMSRLFLICSILLLDGVSEVAADQVRTKPPSEVVFYFQGDLKHHTNGKVERGSQEEAATNVIVRLPAKHWVHSGDIGSRINHPLQVEVLADTEYYYVPEICLKDVRWPFKAVNAGVSGGWSANIKNQDSLSDRVFTLIITSMGVADPLKTLEAVITIPLSKDHPTEDSIKCFQQYEDEIGIERLL